jgi:KDO2-lipid IV(A) lauroyltransferase
VAVFLNHLLAWIFLVLLSRQRRAVARNLAVVLGKTHILGDWLRVRRVFFEFGLTLIECFRIHVGLPLSIGMKAGVRQPIEKALAGGKGAILVTCHLGSWHVAAKALEDADYVLNVIMRAEANPKTRAYLDEVAARRKVRFLYVGEDFTLPILVLQALRRNELVALQADRMFGPKGLTLPFFGKPALFPLGPAILSYLSGAPIIPAIAVRTTTGEPPEENYSVGCLGTILPDRKKNRDAELARLTSAVVQHLEELVRKYPEQWFNFYEVWPQSPVSRPRAALSPSVPEPAAPADNSKQIQDPSAS